MSIGCKIIRDFQRPDPALVERFKGMPVANIDDNMNRIAAVDTSIEPIGKGPAARHGVHGPRTAG